MVVGGATVSRSKWREIQTVSEAEDQEVHKRKKGVFAIVVCGQ